MAHRPTRMLLGLAILSSATSWAQASEWHKITPGFAPDPRPSFRTSAAAVWIPTRDAFVLHGGFDNGSTYFGDVWEFQAGEPEWQQVTPGGTAPLGRHRHSGIYDSIDDELIIFGGQRGASPRNDVWSLQLAGAPMWLQLAPMGTAPAARYGHAAVFDSSRYRMVIVGGRGAGLLNDVWVLTLGPSPTWSLLITAGTAPSPRFGQAAVFDMARDRLVMYGGQTSLGPSNEVWVLDFSHPTPQWSLVNASGIATATAGLAYDRLRDRMVTPLGQPQAFALSTLSWSTIASYGADPLWSTMVAYDPSRDLIVLFNGDSSTDTWRLACSPPARWLRHPRLKSTSSSNDVVYGDAGVYDEQRHQLLWWDVNDYTHLWRLSLTELPGWISDPLTGALPASRSRHRLVVDSRRDRILLFGGMAPGGSVFGDVWALSLTAAPYAWQLVATTSGPPAHRHSAAVAYDAEADRLVVSGGIGASNATFDDTWILSLADTPTWSLAATSGSGPPAGARAGVLSQTQSAMLVVAPSGVWSLDLASLAWTQLSGAPTPGGTGVAFDSGRQRLLLARDDYWGVSSTTEVWAYDVPAGPWALLSTEGAAPAYRGNATVAFDAHGDQLVVAGGVSAGFASDVPRLDAHRLTFSDSTTSCGYAAQVISFTPGTDTWWATPVDALGTSDGWPLTLGVGGAVTLRLEHPIEDASGVDFYVREYGRWASDVDENFKVEASLNGTVFVPVGSSSGGVSGFDLSGSGLSHARFLRITDLAPTEAAGAGLAGADIDAVEIVRCATTVGVMDPVPLPEGRFTFAVQPNPAQGRQEFVIRLISETKRATLAIYALNGQRMWSRALAGLPSGVHRLAWDGRDSRGNRVPPSIYFARLEMPDRSQTLRLVRVQ